jgi:hypothetical protein
MVCIGKKSSKNREVYAVLIGINNYHDKKISQLRYTVRDVHGLYNALTRYGGLSKHNVLALTNQQATKTRISWALRTWLYQKMNRAKGEATAIIYFAGHGWSGGKISYWLPHDAKANNPAAISQSSISHENIVYWVSRLRSNRIVMFIDACNSGFAWSGTRSLNMLQKGFRQIMPSDVFGEGRVTIASSMQNQYSVESSQLQHGIFSYSLIQALSGSADYDRDGVVTLPELWTYLSSNVRRLALKYQNYPQVPVKSGPEAGPIPLSFPGTKTQPSLSQSSQHTRIKAPHQSGQSGWSVVSPSPQANPDTAQQYDKPSHPQYAQPSHPAPTGHIKKTIGWVDIYGNPPIANVLVNGRTVGYTPLRFSLPTGRHKVQVQKAGYRTWIREINVSARKSNLITFKLTLGSDSQNAPTHDADGQSDLRPSPRPSPQPQPPSRYQPSPSSPVPKTTPPQKNKLNRQIFSNVVKRVRCNLGSSGITFMIDDRDWYGHRGMFKMNDSEKEKVDREVKHIRGIVDIRFRLSNSKTFIKTQRTNGASWAWQQAFGLVNKGDLHKGRQSFVVKIKFADNKWQHYKHEVDCD